MILTPFISTLPPKKKALLINRGGEYSLFQVRRPFRLGRVILLLRFSSQCMPGMSQITFFLKKCSVIQMVVPGTLEVGLLILASWLSRVVFPVLGKPIICILLMRLFSTCYSSALMPCLLVLVIISTLIFFIFYIIKVLSLPDLSDINYSILFLTTSKIRCLLRYLGLMMSTLLITTQNSTFQARSLSNTIFLKLPAMSSTSMTYRQKVGTFLCFLKTLFNSTSTLLRCTSPRVSNYSGSLLQYLREKQRAQNISALCFLILFIVCYSSSYWSSFSCNRSNTSTFSRFYRDLVQLLKILMLSSRSTKLITYSTLLSARRTFYPQVFSMTLMFSFTLFYKVYSLMQPYFSLSQLCRMLLQPSQRWWVQYLSMDYSLSWFLLMFPMCFCLIFWYNSSFFAPSVAKQYIFLYFMGMVLRRGMQNLRRQLIITQQINISHIQFKTKVANYDRKQVAFLRQKGERSKCIIFEVEYMQGRSYVPKQVFQPSLRGQSELGCVCLVIEFWMGYNGEYGK